VNHVLKMKIVQIENKLCKIHSDFVFLRVNSY